jgi:hypothetical protein
LKTWDKIRAILCEPLVHFLLAGGALFLAYRFIDADNDTTKGQVIWVGRADLLNYLQQRSRIFEPKRFSGFLDSLPNDDLQQLVDAYVREEALYRRAKAMELDVFDYVTRLRLIQQLEFITRGFIDAQVHVTAEDMDRYYLAHQSKYEVRPKITFAHVFFSNEMHGAQSAEALARAQLRVLNRHGIRFHQAQAYGDRFLYNATYVRCEPEQVASHFGPQMRERLFQMEANDARWIGPLQSTYGSHLVLMVSREVGYLPQLDDVRDVVERDAREAAAELRYEESIESLVEDYDVKIRRDDFATLRYHP